MIKVLYFTAPWCAPCKAMKPIFEDAIKNYNVEKEYVDIEESPDIAQEYGIKGVPTIIFKNEDKVVERTVGVVPKNKLIDVFDKLV